MDDYQFPPRYTPEELDYAVEWTDWLEPAETIVTATVTLMAGDLTISRISNNDKTVLFWLTGGTTVYQRLAVTIATDNIPARIREIEATIACFP